MKEALAHVIVAFDDWLADVSWEEVVMHSMAGFFLLLASVLVALLFTGFAEHFKGNIEGALFFKNWIRVAVVGVVGWRIKPTYRAIVRWARKPERVVEALRKP